MRAEILVLQDWLVVNKSTFKSEHASALLEAFNAIVPFLSDEVQLRHLTFYGCCNPFSSANVMGVLSKVLHNR